MDKRKKSGDWDAPGRVIESLKEPVKKSSMKYQRAKRDLDVMKDTGFVGMDTPEKRQKWQEKKNALQRIINSAK